MTAEEKREVLGQLQAGRTALGAALEGVDEEMAARKPADGGWSIAECVEHVSVSERYLYSRLTCAERAEQRAENHVREARILVRGVDRSRRVECPADGLPVGRFGSLREALADFDAARAETVRFVEEFEDDPRCWMTDHPVIPGPVNVVEIWLTMAVHVARHAKQIVEIRGALGTRAEV
jgi:hypothetical protein